MVTLAGPLSTAVDGAAGHVGAVLPGPGPVPLHSLASTSRIRADTVNLATRVRRPLLLLWKRWLLALVFRFSPVHFLLSTFRQEERAVRDQNLLQVPDHDQPILWKEKFHLGESRPAWPPVPGLHSREAPRHRRLGCICEREDLLVNGRWDINVGGTKQYCCDSCLPHGCCRASRYCMSCCLQPSK